MELAHDRAGVVVAVFYHLRRAAVFHLNATPAKAGSRNVTIRGGLWIPAFAGMTDVVTSNCGTPIKSRLLLPNDLGIETPGFLLSPE